MLFLFVLFFCCFLLFFVVSQIHNNSVSVYHSLALHAVSTRFSRTSMKLVTWLDKLNSVSLINGHFGYDFAPLSGMITSKQHTYLGREKMKWIDPGTKV